MRLALVSHVPAAGLEPSVRSADDDIGGRRPPGGMDWKGDREPDFRQKSAGYFARRLNGGVSEERLAALLEEAREALWAWQHTPDVSGVIELEPARKSFLWKCRIADDTRPLEQIKGEFQVSQATIYRYRLKYRGLRAPGRRAA